MVLPQPAEGPGPRLIKEGDLVIVYESYSSIKSVYINSKQTYSSRFGNFPHKDWVGMPYGARAHSRPPGRGWVQLLAPTAELWTLVLRHRTQILYIADISLVVSHLDLRPGCVVLESGTGSASLTHALARAVAPAGRVRSFEFHELRAREAAAELLRNGLPASLATVELRNIEERGFPDDELEGAADGVFLDLPGPWKVVASAAKCLKPNGRFCSFSPCIEQVQRTCEQLDACGMTDIATYEVLLRNYEVTEDTLLEPLTEEEGQDAAAAAAATRPVKIVVSRPSMDARGHTGYLTFARKFL
ncbi:MAG: tRNA methyltransferase complex GCD14 subunit-domain-containing protein [Monoraphidium minutum]|nr:MAG: tRNA methyltransferase complex GCD14 subunit-domain-containing protein [Monoraphidium minutum]